MRRSDREITDFSDIAEIVRQCDVCRIGLFDGEYPYIVPMNFGCEVQNGQLTLYFHSAAKGRKHELIAHSNKACFELDQGHQLVMPGGPETCSMAYESVMGHGLIEYIDEPAQKRHALQLLMEKYHPGQRFEFDERVVSITRIFKLTALQLSGKRRTLD